MNVIYNIAANTINGALRLYGNTIGRKSGSKFSRFVAGRKGLLDRIEQEMSAEHGDVYWFHAASLGEFQVIRPVMEEVKHRLPQSLVVLTFFSPSGYEALERKRPAVVDKMYYLPIDTARNARRMVEALKPKAAVIAVSEYWPNMLQQLKFHAVPTYLVSAIIRDDSPFFRWYGRTHRKALSAFTHIFTLNEQSVFNLKMLGYTSVTLSGDPLMDNAVIVSQRPWSDAKIETFCREKNVMIAGSISDEHDVELVAGLINTHPNDKFIVVPHEVDPSHVAQIQDNLEAKTAVYSSCRNEQLLEAQVLIIDVIGILSSLYRYGSMAYIGGGFTPLLHSVIEATVYGLPVSFGPRIERKITPQQLIERGIGQMVTTPQELSDWYDSFATDDRKLQQAREKATEFVNQNCGNTARIVDKIL